MRKGHHRLDQCQKWNHLKGNKHFPKKMRKGHHRSDQCRKLSHFKGNKHFPKKMRNGHHQSDQCWKLSHFKGNNVEASWRCSGAHNHNGNSWPSWTQLLIYYYFLNIYLKSTNTADCKAIPILGLTHLVLPVTVTLPEEVILEVTLGRRSFMFNIWKDSTGL